jgi:citrate/tricarballylate utilization protein
VAMAKSFSNRRIGILLALVTASLIILLAGVLRGPALVTRHVGPGAFYEIIPYPVMVATALLLALFAFAIWLRGAVYSWSETAEREAGNVSLGNLLQAVGAMLTLRYLGGGGPGCSYPEEQPSYLRRVYHSLVFWGFLFDFVSTSLAFVYQDFLHRLPPYGLTSAPVIFGTIGGIGIVIGTTGLIYLKTKSDPSQASPRAYGMDYDFLAILGLTALTGIVTLAFRETAALGLLLAIHLAMVAALFVTAPYGKFVHALYRSLALIQFYTEQSSQ